VSQLERAIRHDSRKFREMLPSLLKSYAGRWVVFRDEKVVSAHLTEGEAFEASISQFGDRGGSWSRLSRRPSPRP
jgi:hypothetical protein